MIEAVNSGDAASASVSNRRDTAAMAEGQQQPVDAAQPLASSSAHNLLATQAGGVALRQVGLSVDGEEGTRALQAEHSRSFSQGSHSRSCTSVQAWKSKAAAQSTSTPTQHKRSILPGLAPVASSTAPGPTIASPTNADPIASRSTSSCASRLSNRSSGGSGTEDHALLLPSTVARLQGPPGSSRSAAVSPLEDSASSTGVAPVRSASTQQYRRVALVASGRNQSPFAVHARTASAVVLPRSGAATPPIAASSNSVTSEAKASGVPAQVASAPSQTRRLNPALVERAHLSVQGAYHSRKNSATSGSGGGGSSGGSCMIGADEAPLVYTHAVEPSPGSSASGSAASPVALVAAAAPTLGADVVSAETTRSLNAYLAAPKLMTAEEYRATYPAFDAHNADYMAYRARWEIAEREATASAQNAPGSRPRAASRSLLCTPKNAPRSLSAATSAGSAASVQSSPLSGLRVLTPTLHGAFGYGALSADDPLAAGGVVSGSPLPSPSASLYLPPPSFVDGDVPVDFVHKHSVMAFMVESSRPSSLRATPLKGFVSVAREGVSTGSGAGSLVGTPMAANKRLVIGDDSLSSSLSAALLSPGVIDSSELLLPSPQVSSSSPDAALFRELLVSGSDSSPCSPLAGSFKPKLFTNSMQAQRSPMTQAQAQAVTDAFVPVLPSTHVVEEDDQPESSPVSATVAAAPSIASMEPSSAGGALRSGVGASVRISPSVAAATEARRCFSDGIATRRLNAAQLDLQKRMLAGSEDSGSVISPSTASPVPSVAATTQAASVASTVRISSRRHISAGGSQSPSLPSTPSEADDLTMPASIPVSVSAAVLRSQAHISAITKSWQERLGGGGSGGLETSAVDVSHASAPNFLPAVILDRSSPGHSRAASQSSTAVGSPRLSEDPRSAAASVSVARKLALPAGSRLRAVKCMLPSDRAMTESTPVTLPPAHSPAASINKRRLRLSSGGVLVSSPLGTSDGVNSPLPTPSPTAAGAAAAAVAAAAAAISSATLTSSSSSAGLGLTPSPTTRRRLMLQVPNATSSPIAPHSAMSAGAGSGGSMYSFAQVSSASLPAIASATSLASLHSGASLAEPHSASYNSIASGSSTLSSPVGSTNTTPSSSHRRMFSAGGSIAAQSGATGAGHA